MLGHTFRVKQYTLEANTNTGVAKQTQNPCSHFHHVLSNTISQESNITYTWYYARYSHLLCTLHWLTELFYRDFKMQSRASNIFDHLELTAKYTYTRWNKHILLH